VDLPALAGDTFSFAERTAADPAARPVKLDARGAVLIVDDNEELRNGLCRLLALHGYRVGSAGDGPTALELVDVIEPRVVLVDIGLPGMDGYELARRLRLIRPAGMRLVAVTGYGQPSDRALSQAAGFDAHLVKPVDLDTLRPFLEA
jgi:CheY-like chemotaxis protein